jgi:hypothetical protein
LPDHTEVATLSLEGVDFEDLVAEIEIEEQWNVSSLRTTSEAVTLAVRSESTLVIELRDYLKKRRHETTRHRIRLKGRAGVILTDLYDSTERVLYEAKSSASRESIRMAIGQLLDYRRFVDPTARLAVLVPSPPSADLRNLLTTVGIGVCYKSSSKRFEWEWPFAEATASA